MRRNGRDASFVARVGALMFVARVGALMHASGMREMEWLRVDRKRDSAFDSSLDSADASGRWRWWYAAQPMASTQRPLGLFHATAGCREGCEIPIERPETFSRTQSGRRGVSVGAAELGQAHACAGGGGGES